MKVGKAPVIMQLEFQQCFQFVILKVPQTQFIGGPLVIPVVPQRQVPTMQTVHEYVVIPQVLFLGMVLTHPLLCNVRCRWSRQRSVPLSRFAVAVHRQGRRHPCRGAEVALAEVVEVVEVRAPLPAESAPPCGRDS